MTAGSSRLWPCALLLAHALLLGVSCEGCPSDGGTFIARDFGTLNPLFDKVGFEDFPGRVIDPRRGVKKRFRLEMVLPVVPSSIGPTSVEAFVVPASIGPFSAIPDAPPHLGDLPGTPLSTIRVERLDLVRRGAGAVGLIATFDPRGFADAAGRDVVIQVDPREWRFTTPTTDSVFTTPTRFTFRVSERGPDGDPPFLADVIGLATDPLDEMLDPSLAPSDLPVVPPHAELRFIFSEPMLATAPLVLPQDPAGLQLRPESYEAGGFTDLVTATEAGMVPGREYCVSFVPPGMASVGPLSWGSQDLSGEPLVPAYRTVGLRRAARGLRAATDFCFRTGASRIESPRRGELIAAADSLPSLEFLSDRLCPPDIGCSPDAGWRLSVRPAGGAELGTGWTEIGFFRPDDPAVQVIPTNGLQQGELFIPVDRVIVPLGGELPQGGLPIGLCDTGGLGGEICELDVGVDVCDDDGCQLGDVLGITLDLVPPADVEPRDVAIEDSDPTDGTLDRVCVVLTDSAETAELHFGDVTVELAPAGNDERLDHGRVRRCATRVAVPEGGTTVIVERRDEAGNHSNRAPGHDTLLPLDCRLPPRKHVGFDGRRSALALNLAGIPHVAYTDGAGLFLARWDAAADRWERDGVDCLCGAEPQAGGDVCRSCPAFTHDWGWTVDLTFNAEDQPVLCYTRTLDPIGSAGSFPLPGWESFKRATVTVAIGRPPTFSPPPPPGLARFTRYVVPDPLGEARPMGCSIAARSQRHGDGVADYLVGFTENPGGAGGPQPRLRLVYVRDDAMDPLRRGDVTFTDTPLPPLGDGDATGRWVDIARDDSDAFWVVAQGDPELGFGLFGELPGQSLSEGARIIEIAVNAMDSRAAYQPRVDARGDGDVAVAYSDQYRRPRYLYRRSTDPLVAEPRLVRPDPGDGLTSFNGTFGEPPRPSRETRDTRNRAALASTDDLFSGVPMAIRLPRESQDGPVVAWIPGYPNGVDYNALMLARPRPDATFRFEIVDARVERAGSLDMALSSAGAVRLAWHNLLGSGNAQFPLDPQNPRTGSLSFFREEDEDELFRHPDRSRLRSSRCFRDSVLELDAHGEDLPRSAVSERAIALEPQPSFDPDPCGRTIDPGLSDAIAFERVRGLGAASTPGSRFRRLSGESVAEFTARTNQTRAAAFIRLRQLLGNLAVLDSLPYFQRLDGTSWASFNPVTAAGTDEFFDNGSARSGRLDGLILTLDEFLDDVCGQARDEARQDCRSETPDVNHRLGCRGHPGAFERNPNGYFPGLYYTDVASGADLAGSRDIAAFSSFLTSFAGGALYDDATPVAAARPRGLLRTALRGLNVSQRGVTRTMSHVCTPFEDCDGVPALFMPEGATGTVPVPGGEQGSPDSGQRAGVCPAIRAGATLRHPGGSQLTQIGGTRFGCCTGYVSRPCDEDKDCGPCDEDGNCDPHSCLDGVCALNIDNGTISLTIPACIPISCSTCENLYCDDSLPDVPSLVAAAVPPDQYATFFEPIIASEMGAVRNNACGPGSVCTVASTEHAACTGRQFFGHYAMQLIAATPQGGLLTTITNGLQALPQSVASALENADIRLQEQIADLEVQWRGRSEGRIGLQGYLELTIRFVHPQLNVVANGHDVEISPSRLRLRLQPYFFPSNPQGSACDSCRRRRGDLTVRWVVTEVRMLDVDSERPPEVSTSCDILAETCALDSGSVDLDGVRIWDLEDVPPAIETLLQSSVSTQLTSLLNQVLYVVLSEPLSGGVVFGRREAVDAIVDMPQCMPGLPARPAVTNPNCTSGDAAPGHIAVADTVESLRIVSEWADVLGRENGP